MVLNFCQCRNLAKECSERNQSLIISQREEVHGSAEFFFARQLLHRGKPRRYKELSGRVHLGLSRKRLADARSLLYIPQCQVAFRRIKIRAFFRSRVSCELSQSAATLVTRAFETPRKNSCYSFSSCFFSTILSLFLLAPFV